MRGIASGQPIDRTGRAGPWAGAEGDVAVWWMEVASPPPDVVAGWRSVLDESERARADRFLRPADRVTFTGAHFLTRALLSHVGGLPARRWRFVAGPNGKPEIHPDLRSDLRFNLAHTPGLVAVAVARTPVGVDVERCDRQVAGLRIAERYFAPSEVAMLKGVPRERMMEVFCRLWTLKEAFLKATGDGLRSLDSVSFSLDPQRLEMAGVELRPELGACAGDWQFHQDRPTAEHVLSVALRRASSDPAVVATRAVGIHDLRT